MREALELLRAGQRFILTTHDFPDGDGLGSQMALQSALIALGKQAWVINPSPTPSKFAFIDPGNVIQVFDGSLPTADALFIFDTNELKMLGPMEGPLREWNRPLVFVDHHSGIPDPAGPHWIDVRYAATGELVYELIEALGAPLDLVAATALYVALITDTGGFRYRRTRPLSHRMAAHLLEKGVAPESVFHQLYARQSVARARLLGFSLQNLKAAAAGKLVWMEIPAARRAKLGATFEDTESFIGQLTYLEGVRIAAVFRQDDAGFIRVSLRGLRDTPVVDIAQSFGGGGHAFAAGMRFKEPMAKAVRKVVAACERVLA